MCTCHVSYVYTSIKIQWLPHVVSMQSSGRARHTAPYPWRRTLNRTKKNQRRNVLTGFALILCRGFVAEASQQGLAAQADFFVLSNRVGARMLRTP